MKEKENLNIGRIVGIICLVLLIAAIIIPLINNFLKGSIKILKNDMRVDYLLTDEQISLYVSSQNANSFKCYYGLEENELIEVEVTDNTCHIKTNNMQRGQKYYYKIEAFKSDEKMFEKTFDKYYEVSLTYVLKDKCLNLGFCNDKEVVYFKDDENLYALFKKDDESKAVLGVAVNNFTTYSLNNDDITNFNPANIVTLLEDNFNENFLNEVLINYQFEHDILVKGKLSDEKFDESKVNLLSWFDYENIKNYDYFKNVTTLLASYQIEKKGNIEYHYPIYVKGKESRVLKNMKNNPLKLVNIIALDSNLKVRGIGTFEEPFFLE